MQAALRGEGVSTALVDTAWFPERATLQLVLDPHSSWRGALRCGGAKVIRADLASTIWWRRPNPYVLHRSLGGPRRDGAFCAAHAAFAALWSSFDGRWVNDPLLEEAADDKPRQLALAARLELAVPRSCITNDPAAARDFIRERPEGETIHKNVTSARALWRPTGIALAADRKLLSSLRHVPLLLQERVRAEADVRATIVGDELFAAEIGYPDRRPALDWRVDFRRARVRAVKLPRQVDARLRRLARELGLVYAAIDLRRRADGEHVFLEVNPSGQWLFVERRTEQPVTAALANLLARGA